MPAHNAYLDARFAAAQSRFPLPEFTVEHSDCLLGEDDDDRDLEADIDRYLAAACLRRVVGAPEALMRRHATSIQAALGRMRLTDEQREEAQAALLRIVFVGEGRTGPALSGFRGRGSLDGWIRVTATRAAHRVLRSGARVPPTERIEDELLDGVWRPPERDVLRAECHDAFAEAMTGAFAALAASDRRGLRSHYRDGLSIDVLAEAWKVHRATAARRIARARGELRERTLATLQTRFDLSKTSAARLVQRAQSGGGAVDGAIDGLFADSTSVVSLNADRP